MLLAVMTTEKFNGWYTESHNFSDPFKSNAACCWADFVCLVDFFRSGTVYYGHWQQSWRDYFDLRIYDFWHFQGIVAAALNMYDES